MTPPRLAVICLPGLTSFIEETVTRHQHDFEIHRCYSADPREITAAIASADIVWLEWANELAVQVTGRLPELLRGRRVVLRLHSYELFGGMAAAVRWDVVDDVVFVGTHMRDIARQLCPELFEQVPRVHVIPGGIDLDRFPLLPPRPPGKNLAFVAHLSAKKGPMLLLHAFKALVDADPGFRLFMVGAVQEPRFGLYIDHLAGRWGLGAHVRYEGHIDDVSAWLADKDMVVCTSPIEGQGLGILEAAARGLKPLVHHFVGAEQVYPEPWLWTSIDELVAMATAPHREPEAYRAFVQERYGKERETAALRAMLLGDLTEPATPLSPPPA